MSIAETFAALSVMAAGVAGLLYLIGRIRGAWRRGRQLVRMAETGMEIIQRELEAPESADTGDGSSVKENMTDVARAVGTLQAQYEQMERQIRRVAELGMKHHPEDAWLYYRDRED